MSRWSRRTVAVVLVALMVATAMPAMAADPGLEVADRQETASDFDSGTHTDTTVWGSGSSAVVELADFSDGFEDEPADSGIPEAWTVNNAPSSVNVSTQYALVGSQSMGVNGTNLGTVQPTDFPLNDPITSNISASIYVESGSNAQLFIADGDARVLSIGLRSGDLQYRNSTGYHVLDTAVDNGEWLNLTLYDFDPATDTYSVRWETPDTSGTATGLEMESAMTEGWVDFQVYTDGAVAFYDEFSVEPPASGTFISSNFTASQVEQAWTNLTLANASATVTWEYWDGSQWQAAATNTYTTSGNKTSSVTGHASAQKWRLNLSYSNTAGPTTASLADAGVQFNAATPTVDNGAASPTGDLSSTTVTLSIPVNDSDFATAQGDQVDVEFHTNRSGVVGTDTLTSNGTASTSHTFSVGGDTHWWVEVSDSYGETARSNNFSVSSPSELRIVNESNVSQLVTDATVDLTFYFRNGTGQDFSVTRTTSDGTVNMTGLPTDQPFVVVAEADGYYSRRIFVPSLFETQTVYLLPENETAVDTVFVIEDYTGDFPPDDTVLLVQRSLNGTWETVLGDYFGATREFPGQVAYNERHRLVLMNVETGETKVMGTYTPITAATQEVVVSPSGDLTVRTAGATAAIRPQFGQLPALNGTTVAVRFENNSVSVANWTVNASVNGTTVWLQTYASPQRVTNDLDLAPYAGETLTVRVTYNDTNGTTFLVSERTFQVQQTLDNNATLLAAIQDFAQQSPQQNRGSFTAFLAMAITVLGMAGVASQFPVSSEVVALVGVFILTGFSVIGWVGYGLVFAAGVGTIAFAGLKRGL